LIKLVGFVLTALCIAQAANPHDEQVMRNAYAKLAYAVQTKTVYDVARKDHQINSLGLSKQVRENELRFDISELTSGALTEIATRPFSEFVTAPAGQQVLQVSLDTESLDENGKRTISSLAVPQWAKGQDPTSEDWNTPVSKALSQTGHEGEFSRYVSATITVRYKGQSRTYRALWFFGDGFLGIDLITGTIVNDFVTINSYPSVLTDTSLRSHPAVKEWLLANQRFDASCKTGKQDVCCDDGMRCGVHSADLESNKPAPTTKATPKGKEGACEKCQ
jgi:hypothetical protein